MISARAQITSARAKQPLARKLVKEREHYSRFNLIYRHGAYQGKSHSMELDSCQNPAHTQNVFCSRITIHTHTKRVLLTHNDSHTRSVWFANTKHHSQTNAFCFRNKYSMFYTKYNKKILQVHKTILQVRNTKAARG